jgi:hypothetical protein
MRVRHKQQFLGFWTNAIHRDRYVKQAKRITAATPDRAQKKGAHGRLSRPRRRYFYYLAAISSSFFTLKS